MVRKIARLTWPFVLLILILVLIPQYYFNPTGIVSGAIVASLLLLFQAKRFGLLSLDLIKLHKKVLKDEEKNKQREKAFYRYFTSRVDATTEELFKTVHAESSEVLTYILPVIKYKNEKNGKKIKMQLITCLDKDGVRRELKKLSREMKKDVMDAIRKNYIEFRVLGKKERHFSVTDDRHVMIQEDHERDDPKDMIYAEDNTNLSRKYTQKFRMLWKQSKELKKEELESFLGGDKDS